LCTYWRCAPPIMGRFDKFVRTFSVCDKKWLSSTYKKLKKKKFKSAHNRRCTSSICIQTLCKVWIILIENCLSYRLHYVSTALLGRTYGRRKRLTGAHPSYENFTSSTSNSEHCTLEGYLYKKGALLKGWKQIIKNEKSVMRKVNVSFLIPDFLYHLTNVFTNCSMHFVQLVFKLLEVTLVLIRKSLRFLLCFHSAGMDFYLHRRRRKQV
jgi:hypothetical protein